jgi:hypothetical protein
MGFCEHCEGQRYDRAQVLRLLRATRKKLRQQSRRGPADEALGAAIKAIQALEIPHLERLDEVTEGQTVH